MEEKNEKIKTIVININNHPTVPKYIQVADSIANDILNKKIKQGQRIPSINNLSISSSFSRETIEKAYKNLRDRKLIFTIKNIGNYVSVKELKHKFSVLFLINKPTSYKIEVYNAFIQTLGNMAEVNMYLYYCEEEIFIDAVQEKCDSYDYFIIMPHFKNENQQYVSYTPRVINAIAAIPPEKVIIIDNLIDNLQSQTKGAIAAICQDYGQDIVSALEEALSKLKKYRKLILVYPNNLRFPVPASILEGFIKFCNQYSFDFEVLEHVDDNSKLEVKSVCITIEDCNLVKLIHLFKEKNLITGEDVGVISYNETPFKAILEITVISADFKNMGEKAAKLLLNNKREIYNNRFNYIERNSL